MKFAMIFPGQGAFLNSRIINENFKYSSVIKDTFDEASECVKLNLWKELENKKNLLNFNNLNKYIQSIHVAASVSIYRLWMKKIGMAPIAVAGHSLGEYSALVCSDVLKFSDAIKIVHKREKLMLDCVSKNSGCMLLIIGLTLSNIKKIISYNFKREIISIACVNTDNNIVVSGKKKL